MKAIIITAPGGPDVLQIQKRPVPQLKPGEVLVKVAAAGVNRPDIAQRKGNYPPPPGAPIDIPGLEIAGVITEVAPDVTRWQSGDRVCALVVAGGYAEYCAVPAGQCLHVPGSLTLIEAATLPETYFTVWSNVFDRAKLQPRESLLVHGGSSGIGTTAIQMAKAMGSAVYVTAGSADKCKFCERLGAAKAINYKTESFKEEIKHLTDGKGVNVILDMIGGDYTPGNIASLATEGRLVYISSLKGTDATINIAEVMRKRLIITGSMLRSRDVGFKTSIAQKLEEHVWPHLASGKIKPVIYKVFAAEAAAEAHQLMESSDHMGKIVLTF